MPVAERKSGMPLSVEMPAPVSTTHGWRRRTSSARADSLAIGGTVAPCHSARVTEDLDGFAFHTEVTVRFAETDAQGVAHNSAYLVWFEVARVAYLAEHAGGYNALRKQGLEALVVEAHVRYGVPARFDDRLRIHARVRDVRGARF